MDKDIFDNRHEQYRNAEQEKQTWGQIKGNKGGKQQAEGQRINQVNVVVDDKVVKNTTPTQSQQQDAKNATTPSRQFSPVNQLT
ncbi:hypothetical protein SLIQ_15900 [Serratia liquefaciens FK01]|nr:hypothetical protein SLIQ_15900 [Serratia liquefaciens FK01]